MVATSASAEISWLVSGTGSWKKQMHDHRDIFFKSGHQLTKKLSLFTGALNTYNVDLSGAEFQK